MHFREWKYMYLDQFSLKIIPEGQIDNIPALV